MIRMLLSALLLSGALVQAAPAVAGTCGSPLCWGAVAAGPKGAYGFSHSQLSEREAYELALTDCSGSCTIVRTFNNSCAAIAVAKNGRWGWGNDPDRKTAKRIARASCSEQGSSCYVRVWSCSK